MFSQTTSWSNGNSFAKFGNGNSMRNPESTEVEGCPLMFKYLSPVQDII